MEEILLIKSLTLPFSLSHCGSSFQSLSRHLHTLYQVLMGGWGGKLFRTGQEKEKVEEDGSYLLKVAEMSHKKVASDV